MAKQKPTPAAENNPWPARLKALRERLGLKQREMAAKFRITTRAYAAWEYGEKVPSAPFQLLIELLDRGVAWD